MNQQNTKPPTFFRFEDLRIYHKALDYVLWVKAALNDYALLENAGLAQGFNKSAQEIVLNIAEGSARNKAQFVSHLKQSKSAIRACLVYTSLLHRENIISDEAEDESRNQLMEMTKMLGALITSLQKNTHQEEAEEDVYPSKNFNNNY
ncbi:MAG: four helix bundle protein [Bacteroidales bacterium]|jgi:four helix bundle protein|nr:four helix bundle protein [Bacteroidales bacterium]